MENALRYHAEIDLSQKDTSQAQLIRLTGRNKEVLEVGPATGYVTKILRERGCRVWCIEIDPEAAEAAAEFSERMVVGNIETMDLVSTFPDERFDVVTFGDVLEHLVDPLSVLIRVKDSLKPRGYVVASVPNVAHASVRLSLLAGRFDYLEAGLLDRTHLRFFTQKSLADLFHDAGYEVRSWRRVLADPFATEVGLREHDYPAYLAEAARGDLEAITYQFVLKAYPAEPAPDGHVSPAAATGRNVLTDMWRWQDENEELRAEAVRLEEKVRAREETLTLANATLAERERLLADRERSLDAANAQLAGIRESLGYKLLEGFRRRARWLFPVRSRRGAPYRLVVRLVTRIARARRGPPTSTSPESRDKYGR